MSRKVRECNCGSCIQTAFTGDFSSISSQNVMQYFILIYIYNKKAPKTFAPNVICVDVFVGNEFLMAGMRTRAAQPGDSFYELGFPENRPRFRFYYNWFIVNLSYFIHQLISRDNDVLIVWTLPISHLSIVFADCHLSTLFIMTTNCSERCFPIKSSWTYRPEFD